MLAALLGSVGEPINPEAWMWYHEVIGGKPLPDRGYVVADGDGRDMISPLPGAMPTKPGSATLPFPGVDRRRGERRRASRAGRNGG